VRRQAIIAALALIASAAGAQPVKPGAHAPNINLPALTGSRVQLSKLRGHPVIVSFWATWCSPCRAEFPELVKLQQQYDSVGLRVLGVNGTDQERSTKELSVKAIQEFVDNFAVSFPIALDTRGQTRRAFHIARLPTTVFIDSAGVIQHVHEGAISREELERGVATILPSR
jgi:cytochrome c biogenesis protein CcmG, thiol:disulfide interchange protein DsbE